MTSTELREPLLLLARILLRCWIFGFALLLLFFGIVTLGGDALNSMWSNLLGIGPLSHFKLTLINYSLMGFMEILIWLFFFGPWLAIKLVVKK